MRVETARRLPGPLAVFVLSLLVPGLAARALDEFVRIFERNQGELSSYGWKSRTEIELDGEMQTVQLFQVRYDPQGIMRKTLISEEQGAGATPRKQRTRKKKQKRQQQVQAELEALIDSYVQPTPDATQRMFETATVWEGAGRQEGVKRIRARNVLRQGDEVSLWVDSASRRPQRLLIVTSSAGEPVKVTTEFGVLDEGPFYPSLIVVETEIKEKKLILRTENFEYRPMDGTNGM